MLKRQYLSTAAAVAAIMTSSGIAHAQYSGPSSAAPAAPSTAPLTTVSAVLKDGRDDQKVTLTGFLKEKVGNEKYTFTDGANEIRVEIDDEDFPTGKIDDKVKVEITGEVEKDFLQTPEIDVETVKVVQ